MKQRVLMAMSGGIDSSVAAMLLRESGYDLIGVTYRVHDPLPGGGGGCSNTNAITDARQLAHQLGIEHHVLDLRQAFGELVIRDFIDEYLRGRTPNPCVLCNAVIKWGKLAELADRLGCDHIATGHYARVAREGNRYFLRKGVDETKDQTYFLWRLSQENLARTLFPLGEYTKAEVRQMALARGHEQLSRKSESQEICFIPDNDYRTFLAANVPDYNKHYGPGPYVDTAGHVLGTHQGYPNYTIGQRKGLGIALGHPAFVVAIHPERNEVVLGTRDELQGTTLHATRVNHMKYATFPDGLPVTVKIRYRNAGVPAIVHPVADGIRLNLLTPIDSITPGQSVVLYDGPDLLAGAIINE